MVSVICVETSLHSTAQLGMESVLHSDFPPNPDEGSWSHVDVMRYFIKGVVLH